MPSGRCRSRRCRTPRLTAGLALSPGGHETHERPGRLAGRRGADPLLRRVVVAGDALAPAAVVVLPRQQPADGAPHVGRLQVLADRREPAQHLPGAVEIVDPPAAVPAPLGGLIAAQEPQRAADGRVSDAEAGEVAQGLEHARRDVGGAGIDHGVVIGEGDGGQPLLVVAAVEAGPPAVVVLHPHHPGEPAPHRLGARLGRAAGAGLGQHHERHAGVVDVGVKLVLPFEVPAAGRRRVAHRPVAGAARLLAEQPGHGAGDDRIVGRQRPLAGARASPAPCPRPATGRAACAGRRRRARAGRRDGRAPRPAAGASRCSRAG